jgi:hypothetical protein
LLSRLLYQDKFSDYTALGAAEMVNILVYWAIDVQQWIGLSQASHNIPKQSNP